MKYLVYNTNNKFKTKRMTPEIPKHNSLEMLNGLLTVMHKLGGYAHIDDVIENLALELNLTKEQRDYMIPNNNARLTKFAYNTSWTKHSLKVFGLIESPKRQYWALTQKGLQTKSVTKDEIQKALKEHAQRRKSEKIKNTINHSPNNDQDTEKETSTPITFNKPYRYKINTQKPLNGVEKLLNILKSLNKNGQQLERIVIALLESMNEYKNIEPTPTSNDKGIDIIAERQDNFTDEVERIVIQVKNYTANTISNKEIRDLRGSAGYNDRCWFITTTDFSNQAKEEAERTNTKKAVKLTNGIQLAHLLIKHNVGLKYIFQVED